MSTGLSLRNADPDLPSQEVAHAIAGTMEQLKAIRTFVKDQFKPGVDAGTIKGCGDKPTLLLPGAQKATMYFNCYPTYKVHEKDLGLGHVSFRVRCLLISRATREQVGEGIGCASTREKKWMRGGSAKPCPSCGNTTIMRSKEEYGGGYYCNAKNGGCGAKFAKNHKGLSEAKEVQVDDGSAYEMHNTVLKMAKKRAHVDAAMTLGCLSELFTQDIEDTYRPADVREAARPYEGEVYEEAAPEPAPPPRHPQGKNSLHPNESGFHNGQYASPEQTQRYLDRLKAKVDDLNGQWADFWQDPKTGEIPEPAAKDLMNVYQADGHIVKWLVETGQIDQDALEKNGKAATLGRHAAIVANRSEAEARAMKAELASYMERCFNDKKEAIYRKHPDLAPEGYAEEQAEAAAVPAGSGDAYEGGA